MKNPDSPLAAKIGGADKAAVLLLSLGEEGAAEVMRHLGEAEQRAVSQALARTRVVDPQHLDLVRREYVDRLDRESTMVVDGKGFAIRLLERALIEAPAAPRRDEMIAEVERLGADGNPLASLLEGVPAEAIAQILAAEHPQVGAVLLAHLPAEAAADVLLRLPEAQRADLVDRVAHLDAVPEAIVAELASTLVAQLRGASRPGGDSVGGAKVVAEMMNHADPTVEQQVLEELERSDPDLVNKVRGLMFTFEDCIKLDPRSLQTLLKEIARDDLLLALKTASPTLSDKIFASVSTRAAEILQEDLASAGPVRLRDVEEAQGRIIATLRELESEGKVVIASGGKGDVLV